MHIHFLSNAKTISNFSNAICKTPKLRRNTLRTYYFVKSLLLAASHRLSWVLLHVSFCLVFAHERTSATGLLFTTQNALASLRRVFWTSMARSGFKSPPGQYFGVGRWISWLSKHWSEKGVSDGGTRIIGRAVLIKRALTVRLRSLRRALFAGFAGRVACE